jgi:hypothetical protein
MGQGARRACMCANLLARAAAHALQFEGSGGYEP